MGSKRQVVSVWNIQLGHQLTAASLFDWRRLWARLERPSRDHKIRSNIRRNMADWHVRREYDIICHNSSQQWVDWPFNLTSSSGDMGETSKLILILRCYIPNLHKSWRSKSPALLPGNNNAISFLLCSYAVDILTTFFFKYAYCAPVTNDVHNNSNCPQWGCSLDTFGWSRPTYTFGYVILHLIKFSLLFHRRVANGVPLFCNPLEWHRP